MAEATQEGQVHQSEQLDALKNQMGKDLTAVIQQLMLTNASDSSFKAEFQDANSKILQEVLEGNKLGKQAILGDNKGESAESGRWKKLLGHFGWAKKFAERGAKLAKLASTSAVKFGKTKLGAVTKFAGNMLDLLLKGLGLAVLWKLFDWLSKNSWEQVEKDVKGWVEAIGLNWEETKKNVTDISNALWEWKGAIGAAYLIIKGWPLVSWLASFGTSSLALLWNSLGLIFGATGKIFLLLGKVTKWTETLMFGDEGVLAKLWKGIKSVFGPGSKIGTLVGTVKNWAAAGLFGETGVLTKLWTNLKAFFGIGGKLSQSPGFLRSAEEMVDLKFTKEGPLAKLFNNIRKIFGAEGRIAQYWTTIKGGMTWLTTAAKESAVGKFFGSLSGIFGEGGRFQTIGTWVGEKWKTIKNFFSVGKDGGPLTKLFSFIGNVTSGIGSAFTNIKQAKWFKIVMSAFAGAKGILSAIMVPLRFILLPFTWILGIGSAVMGFVEGFKAKEGVKDERSLGDKIKDGLKGAFKGILDFFVIDLVVMMQDLVNWMIGKVNVFAKYIPGFDGFDKVTFGTDMANWTTDMLQMSDSSAASEKMKGPIDINKVLRESGGELKDTETYGKQRFEMDMDKFGSAIDLLDMEELQAMSEKLIGMSKDKDIDVVNQGGLGKRLHAEIKERTAQIAEMKKLALEMEQKEQGGGSGNINQNNITTSVSKGSTTMLTAAHSKDQFADLLQLGSR